MKEATVHFRYDAGPLCWKWLNFSVPVFTLSVDEAFVTCEECNKYLKDVARGEADPFAVVILTKDNLQYASFLTNIHVDQLTKAFEKADKNGRDLTVAIRDLRRRLG